MFGVKPEPPKDPPPPIKYMVIDRHVCYDRSMPRYRDPDETYRVKGKFALKEEACANMIPGDILVEIVPTEVYSFPVEVKRQGVRLQ